MRKQSQIAQLRHVESEMYYYFIFVSVQCQDLDFQRHMLFAFLCSVSYGEG